MRIRLLTIAANTLGGACKANAACFIECQRDRLAFEQGCARSILLAHGIVDDEILRGKPVSEFARQNQERLDHRSMSRAERLMRRIARWANAATRLPATRRQRA